MTDFDGLVAVVTGGTYGIGAATVAALQSRGAIVATLDTAADCDKTADLPLTCDVRDPVAVDAAVATVVDRFGRIDILVNNAGIGATGDVTVNADDEWHSVLDVNVVGIARVSRAALPHLRRSPAASIVNTCSIAAQIGLPQRALYSASKGAVAALTLAMAADHVGDGIRVNAVIPGTADTPWVARLLDAADDPDAAGAALRGRQPIGRLVSADEVAYAITYLAGPQSASATGVLLAVDGGVTGLRLAGAPPMA
ncbi:SDR family NAD(P)-dependent oxidoreductase [Phytohabitans flavus]|uniref:SDR family NAD(P)-dependent oxidoreductase n=1 Tax=Phytohabitans flavus TaxID=1076124 RepID=UPI003629CB66